MQLDLRPYQKEIIEEAVKSNLSTLIQIPTGGGKTIIAKEIALHLTAKGKQVVFLSPKIVLMEQTAEVFKGLKPHIVHGNNKYDKDHHVLISTLQTMTKRKDIDPDVIIIDEIHYGYSGEMISTLKKEKPNSRLIGLSATPYDKDGVLLKGFGLVLDQYDVDYMIEHNYLVPIKSYKPMTPRNLNKIDTVAGDYHLGQLSKLMGDKDAVMEVVSATKKFVEESKKTIVFAVNIHHAELLNKAYYNEGFKSDVVHSGMDRQSINKTLFLFKNGHIKVLVSVSMLTTGFDVPDVDTAVIARPTKSQNLYKQMVGRIMRLSPDKKYGTLLDCGGIIDNLGLPTEKVKEKKALEYVGKLLCSFCGNDKLYPKKIDGKFYWFCSKCGSRKEAKEARSYKCKKCGRNYGQDAILEMTGNALYMLCSCGYRSEISSTISENIMGGVFDSKTIDLLNKRLVRDYENAIIKFHGRDELFKETIQKHVMAINYNIRMYPDDFFEVDIMEYINDKNRFLPLIVMDAPIVNDIVKKTTESSMKKLSDVTCDLNYYTTTTTNNNLVLANFINDVKNRCIGHLHHQYSYMTEAEVELYQESEKFIKNIRKFERKALAFLNEDEIEIVKKFVKLYNPS